MRQGKKELRKEKSLPSSERNYAKNIRRVHEMKYKIKHLELMVQNHW